MAPTILANRLTKRYGGGVTALDALDLEIDTGEVFGYLGPNGAGKSTTIALLLGLIRPTSGEARIFDLDVGATRRRSIVAWPMCRAKRTCGRAHRRGGPEVPRQHPQLCGQRLPRRTRPTVRASLRTRRSGRYSHGNRQKILLIAAFASRAEVLLLDEPTTGLDPLMEQVFRVCVHEARNRGQTVLLSSHVLSEVGGSVRSGGDAASRPDHRDWSARRAPRHGRAPSERPVRL